MKKNGSFLYYLLAAVFLMAAVTMISSTAAEDMGENLETARANYSRVSVDRIVVSLQDFELLAFSKNQLIARYPVSIGADTGPTPTGEFKVINKLKNPWYTPADEEAQAPGPDNPIGTRWIGINKPSYGIHGTRDPHTIGSSASKGCVRLYNEHVEILYEQVKPGTQVIIKKSISADLRRQTALFEPPAPGDGSAT